MILNTDWCFCPMEERFPLLSLRLHWFNPVTPMASHGTGATPTKQLNLIIRSAPGSFLGATANDALAAKTPASNAVRILTNHTVLRPPGALRTCRTTFHFVPILSLNRLSCSSVQYPQSSRMNTDVYGIVMRVFST